MCDIFEAKRRVMVRAEFAGCGKTYSCKGMELRGHKVLIVCPTNKLAQKNKGVTMHKFFEIGHQACAYKKNKRKRLNLMTANIL